MIYFNFEFFYFKFFWIFVICGWTLICIYIRTNKSGKLAEERNGETLNESARENESESRPEEEK